VVVLAVHLPLPMTVREGEEEWWKVKGEQGEVGGECGRQRKKKTLIYLFSHAQQHQIQMILRIKKYYLLLIDGNTTSFRLNSGANFPTKTFK
jgi:hypothetical protein